MKKIRYVVAASLDGYIAGPNGEADWIVMDPEIDFGELWQQFDTLLMGRRTYEAATARLGKAAMSNHKLVVASRTLRGADHPELTIIPEMNRSSLDTLRSATSKDIWLSGGGKLFNHLLEIGEVDTVEVSIMPVLLGAGIALLPNAKQRAKLKLSGHRIYRSGVVSLLYDVQK
jgi:dihydrofolate reductase